MLAAFSCDAAARRADGRLGARRKPAYLSRGCISSAGWGLCLEFGIYQVGSKIDATQLKKFTAGCLRNIRANMLKNSI